MKNFTRMFFQPIAPVGKNGERVTGSDEHIALSRRAAGEGMVLLKNEGALPLKKGARVAVFGKAQYDFVKGGGGSGDVFCAYTRNIYEGLKIKADEGKIVLYDGLYDFYKTEVEAQYKEGVVIGKAKEPVLPPDMVKKARESADIAIVTVSRYSREHFDRSSERGDFYLSEEEEVVVLSVLSEFDTVIALLNVGGMVDSEWFKDEDKVSGALLLWNAGMEGGLAAADILVGDVNPSGKLTDTFAKGFDDYPSSANFNESEKFVKYTDDIYVGYRYFETIPSAKDRVNYPFGFGLSYTDFEIKTLGVTEKDGKISAEVEVKNCGKVSGREVVQLYLEAPSGKLGRPARELKAFRKTSLLNSGESETLTLEFEVADMATFDDVGKVKRSAFLLERGEYLFHIGNSVRNTTLADYKYKVEEEYRIIKEVESFLTPTRLDKRLTSDGSYEEMPRLEKTEHTYPELKIPEVAAPEREIKLSEVAEGKATLDEFMAQLDIREMIGLLGGQPCTGVSNTCGMGVEKSDGRLSVYHLGIPSAQTADGPAGLRLIPRTETPTTAFPCATLLACSWDPELLFEVGQKGALEVLENNLSIWLTPGLNIHRSPLCGRNFEYYSEDPLVSGKMAAAMVRGIQSEKIGACPKHFACNNKEIRRKDSDSIVSERALREIYLKGFEICVKESDPYLIMTSYNLVNGTHTSESKELLTGILRGEWGYRGLVTTDWTGHGLHVDEVAAGNDVSMPIGFPQSFEEALFNFERGGNWPRVTRADVYACARRVLEMLIKLY